MIILRLAEFFNILQVLVGFIPTQLPLYDVIDDGAIVTRDGCIIDQLEFPNECLRYEELNKTANEYCTIIHDMKLNDSLGLMACGDQKFNRIEFECCPSTHQRVIGENAAFKLSKERFLKFLPEKTEGCDPKPYYDQKLKTEKSHEEAIAKYVKKLNKGMKLDKLQFEKLRGEDPNAANKEVKKTIQNIQLTFNRLKEKFEMKSEKLRVKYEKCITKNILQKKREAMLAFINVVQNVTDVETVKSSLQNLIEICEKERNQLLSSIADPISSSGKHEIGKNDEVLLVLNNINMLVNESITLLSFIPKESQKLINLDEIVMNKAQQTDDHLQPEIDQILKDYEYFYSVIQETKDEASPKTSTFRQSKISKPEYSTTDEDIPHVSSPLKTLIAEFEKLEPVINDEFCRDYDGDVNQIKQQHHMKMERLVENYSKAEKAYKVEYMKNAFEAEQKFRDEVKTLKDTLADIERQSEQEEKRFWSKHADCLGNQLLKEKRDAMKKYTSTILKHPLKGDEIVQAFQELLLTCQHEQLYQSQKEMPVKDEGKAMIKSHSQELNGLIDKSIEMLKFLPVGQSTQSKLMKQVTNIKEEMKMA